MMLLATSVNAFFPSTLSLSRSNSITSLAGKGEQVKKPKQPKPPKHPAGSSKEAEIQPAKTKSSEGRK